MSVFDFVALLCRQTTRRSEQLSHAIYLLQTERNLEVVFEGPTLIVLASTNAPYFRVSDDGGVIFGYLFRRADSSRVTSPEPGLDVLAEDFVQRYWGGYIALRSRYATPEVLRDPSGSIPCYHAAVDDVEVVTSRPDYLVSLNLVKPEIDPTILAQSLVHRNLHPARTILRGISEVPAGVAIRLFPTGLQVSCVWSPWDFIAPTDASFEAASETLRDVVKTSIAAWTSCFSNPLLEVSGGLDSSIVAAVAARAGARHAVTFAAIDGDPVELPYAHGVAAYLDLAMTVVPTGVDMIDIGISEAAGLPRPYARCFSQALHRGARAHAEAIGADAIFSGGGGDNVFCYLLSLAPAIDRIRAEGLGRGALETIGDLAELGNANVWNVGYRTLRRLARRRAPSLWTMDERLLSADAIASLPFPQGHPWTDIPIGAAAGKISHVRGLLQIQNHLEGHGPAPVSPLIAPLLSQPVMEACLAIPSWQWCHGGINRAVARRAFADALPATIIERRSKGAFDSLAAQLLKANLTVVRELLHSGVLADLGIIDVQAVEVAFADARLLDSVRLWHLIDTEVWARSWRATTPA